MKQSYEMAVDRILEVNRVVCVWERESLWRGWLGNISQMDYSLFGFLFSYFHRRQIVFIIYWPPHVGLTQTHENRLYTHQIKLYTTKSKKNDVVSSGENCCLNLNCQINAKLFIPSRKLFLKNNIWKAHFRRWSSNCCFIHWA